MDNADKKQQDLLNKTSRNINNTQWTILVAAENIQTAQLFMLLPENLLQIQFKNSLELPVPELILTYRDNSFAFSQFIHLNKIKFHVSIKAARFSKQLQPINYTGEFILSDFQLKAHEKEFAIYILRCKQIDILKLVQNVNYSTNKQTLNRTSITV